MKIGRARRHELPPPRGGRVGVGVTLEKGSRRGTAVRLEKTAGVRPGDRPSIYTSCPHPTLPHEGRAFRGGGRSLFLLLLVVVRGLPVVDPVLEQRLEQHLVGVVPEWFGRPGRRRGRDLDEVAQAVHV